MRRVVSMIASSTEIVCALGREGWLVGRSHECDFPPTVERLPVLTAPKLRIGERSAGIDAQVKELLNKALSIYEVDALKLRELRPDVILTQDQCEVCAVSTKDVQNALCEWTGGRPELVSLKPDGLEDVFADIRRVAAALEAPDSGQALAAELRARLDAVAARAREASARPRVALIEWIDPLMSAGNWMPELVELAGGRCVFGEAGKHSPWLRFEELRREDPDVICVLPCGFDLARTRREMPALTSLPGWTELSAVRGGRVYLADGNQYFNRPGPRLAESTESLAQMLHPELFRFGHPGWEAL